MVRVVRVVVAGTLLGMAGVGMAAGDAPVKLDRRQAAAEYARVRALLVNEGRACPAGQTPISGLVTGGAAPGQGSRTVTIMFDKGGVVKIVRSWSGQDEAANASTFTVTCGTDPAKITLNTSDLRPGASPQDAAERCRQAEASLRVPPSGKCPPAPVASRRS